jgi:hypothetical protein
MASLRWVRLDSGIARNHKVLALLDLKDGHRAINAYVFGLGYCGEQGTDGFIPRNALPFIHARPVDAARLVEVRLWHVDPGGWLVNDWREYQPSSEESEKRSMKARAAAAARWSKSRGDSA